MMWREHYRLYVHGSISKEFLERGKYTLVVFNDIDKLASSAHMQEGATTQPVIETQINCYWHVTTHTATSRFGNTRPRWLSTKYPDTRLSHGVFPKQAGWHVALAERITMT
jgi:hypothetical protein